MLFRAAQNDIGPDVLPAEVVDAYRTLEHEAGLGADGVAGPPDGDREPMDPQRSYEDWRDTDEALSYAGGLMGGLLSPLRQLSFWTMKKRARLVGEIAGHQLLRRLLDARDGLRIHLMGHSFGCIVTSGMLRGADGEGVMVSSVFLVQGAMSLWSYAKTLPGKPSATGYFRLVVERPCVRGALVATTSKFDRAVGMLYPKAAGLFRQADYGTAPLVQQLPIYGAVGTFGLQGAGIDAALHKRGTQSSLSLDYWERAIGLTRRAACDSSARQRSEIHEDWIEAHRYLNTEMLRKQRLQRHLLAAA